MSVPPTVKQNGQPSQDDRFFVALTLPTAKAGGFLDHSPLPSHERSSVMSPSVYGFGCAPPYQSIGILSGSEYAKQPQSFH